jgi:hypothetical protein
MSSDSNESLRSWAEGVVQVVESLPSKLEALSSNPSTEKIKKQNKTKQNLKVLELPVQGFHLEYALLLCFHFALYYSTYSCLSLLCVHF